MDVYRQPIPNQMLENILSLEDIVGDALDVEPFLQAMILEKKLDFYEFFSEEVRVKQEKT